MAFWLSVSALGLIVLGLALYLLTLRRGLRQISRDLREKMETDTNTLLSVSSGDPALRELAADLNTQLRALRKERLKLRHGDLELKEAVTNISHDLRTPLTAIRGYLDLLEREPKTEAAARYLSIVRERTEALTSLTEELFRYSVIVSSTEDLRPRKLCLNRALEESVAAFYGAFTQRGVTPKIYMTPQPVERDLDPEALGRVFSNILNNALKYSDGDLEIGLSPQGEIFFSNSAQALTPLETEKLFDRFYTVTSARNSTGLGLSIAKLLTEKMGGRIRAVYEDGKLRVTLVF